MSRTLQSEWLALAAILLLSLMDALVKLAGETLSVPQIMLMRTWVIFAAILLAAVLTVWRTAAHRAWCRRRRESGA